MIEPLETSYSLGIKFIKVDLPLPVEPMKAIVSPADALKLTCSRVGNDASG